jgi:SagB-type dehydrogenase family enzyme
MRATRRAEVLAGIAILAALAATARPVRAEVTRILETVELPDPVLAGDMSLEEALSARRSQRRYLANSPLSLAEIGQLFWAAQGMNRPGLRTTPSAGALYPLEIYSVTRRGLYHYRPEGHEALVAWRGALLDSLWLGAGGNKDAIRRAAAVFVITGVVARTEVKYGERALRYVTLEAGHAAQNLLLQAEALDLAAVPIGAYQDARVRAALDLPEDQIPFYLIPVGRPSKD